MKIAILGTGNVGTTLGTRLSHLGHEVWLGSRSAHNTKGAAWLETLGSSAGNAHLSTFSAAADAAELVFNCTAGVASLEALTLAGESQLAGKILIDVSNPLDFSGGMPPVLSTCNHTSLGEQIQATFPRTKVVKTLNTVSAPVMINPKTVPGDHTLFLCGNDDEAKRTVETNVLKQWFGWSHVLDLGDITAARGTEMYLPLWLRMWGAIGSPMFNIAVCAAAKAE